MSTDTAPENLQPRHLRHVLGHHPTGVAVITAVSDDLPHGMAVGSFSSVSLSPPLVAFMPGKDSTSYPAIQRAGAFAVNILASDQEHLCRRFASKGGAKFADLSWHPSDKTGSPILERVVAWIDCEIETVHDAGDHFLVLGRVLDLSVVDARAPLIFFQSAYTTVEALRLDDRTD